MTSSRKPPKDSCAPPSSRKDIGKYFEQSRGCFPKAGVVGVESDWMHVGPLSLPNGKLWAGDPHQMAEADGFGVKVPKGDYRVEIKGVDFDGHRRISRVRACLDGVEQPALGQRRGRTGTETAWIALCDMNAFKKAVPAKRLRKYGKEIEEVTSRNGYVCGVVEFTYSGKSFQMALQPSGLGDGVFEVYPLLSKGKTVGMEVEFIPPRFKLDHDIPVAGMPARDAGKSIPGKREFLKACENGDAAKAKRFLQKRPDLIHARGPIGVLDSTTPLHMAAMDGHAKVAEVLLKAGHEVDAVDQFRNTPLIDACTHSHAATIRVLLKHGAMVNAVDEVGDTPLIRACGDGNLEVVQMLLDHKAKVNVANHIGKTPMFEACGQENPEIVRLLLKHKASVNVREKHWGTTPLHTAVSPKPGHVEMVKLLLAAGADPGARDRDKKTPLDRAIDYAEVDPEMEKTYPTPPDQKERARKILEILRNASRKT